jgi:hypothetical protein
MIMVMQEELEEKVSQGRDEKETFGHRIRK